VVNESNNSATYASVRWTIISAMFAIFLGAALYAIVWFLRDSFVAADSLVVGRFTRGRGAPLMLLMMVAVLGGWLSTILAERTWGCTGWPLLISVTAGALLVGVTLSMLVHATLVIRSPTINVAGALVAIVFAISGSFAVYWRR
jgi:hypothetical protein